MKNEYSLFIRNFDCKQIVCNEEYFKEMEDLQTNRKYEYMNTYLQDQIFSVDLNEVKLGYLNINGLKNKTEDIDEDKNLLNLDCLVLSETKLAKDMKVNFCNWNFARYDFEDKKTKSPHLGMVFLTKKTPKIDINVEQSSSINLSGKTRFQFLEVSLTKHSLRGIFFYVNKKPQKKDVTAIIKHFGKYQLDFFIGDLNLNYFDEEDRRRISELELGLEICPILYQNTRKNSHLDHVMITKSLKLQTFATSFANLYTDHSSVTLRICKNGKYTPEFVDDQIRRQGLNYLIQKDPLTSQKPRDTENQVEDDLLMKGKNFVLYESELYRLKPPEFLSDEIINAYMHLLSEKYVDVFFFDTHFHKTLEENGFNSSRSYVKVNPFSSKRWIMPVNFQNCHWILLHLELEHLIRGQVTMDLYDSATKMNFFYDIQTNEICKYIKFMYEKYQKSSISNLELILRNISSTLPQQTNNYDCGVFVIGYAICLAATKKIKFDHLNINTFRPNMKHEFRRKALDRNCCLFTSQSANQGEQTFPRKQNQHEFELPSKGKKRPAKKCFESKRQNKEPDHGSFGTSSTLGGRQKENDKPTRFSNDGTLCWLNSLIHLFFLIYTSDKGSALLHMLLKYKRSSKIEDASFFREQLTSYDNTLR